MSNPIAQTPEPPYYAVVFTSRSTGVDPTGYDAMAARMLELSAEQPGYLGVESTRDDEGLGITVSYWRDLESIQRWRDVTEHRHAQVKGREKWYESFQLRICRVEREYGFQRGT